MSAPFAGVPQPGAFAAGKAGRRETVLLKLFRAFVILIYRIRRQKSRETEKVFAGEHTAERIRNGLKSGYKSVELEK